MSESATSVGEARRREIVDATIDVIAAHGLAGASLSRIASRAGVSKPAVLYHVENRDALIESTVKVVRSGYVEAVDAAVEEAPDARQAVFSYVEQSLRYLWAHPTHLRVLAEMAHAAPDRAKTRTSELVKLIEKGASEGVLATSDPLSTAVAITGALDAILDHGLNVSGEEQENLAAEAVGLVDRIVTPR